jgi:voltage-gated potassium channel
MASIGKDSTLLAGLVTMLVTRPLLAYGSVATRIFLDGVFAAVFLGVAFVIFTQRRERLWALMLVFLILVISLAHYALPDRLQVPLAVAFHVCMVGFAGLAVAVILRDIFEKSVIGGGDILGVVSGFLLAGIVWGNLYALIYLLEPGAFALQPEIAWQLREWQLRRALFDFLSFATLTGLGSNYITPATPFADTLTWLEVMFGQFYLAVVVAQLVGMKLAQAIQPGGPESR